MTTKEQAEVAVSNEKRVQRYALANPRGEQIAGWWSVKFGMTTSESGDYVLYKSYDTLAASEQRLAEALRASEQRVGELLKAMNEHNADCQNRCGNGEQEAVACGYRSYFTFSGRRCSACPTYEKIEIPPVALAARKGEA